MKLVIEPSSQSSSQSSSQRLPQAAALAAQPNAGAVARLGQAAKLRREGEWAAAIDLLEETLGACGRLRFCFQS